ncbi:GNAT family N-acetyltransferase [Hymenobacter sp. 5414T-23]|uniref:GNAT family N-acetyltransferase n=1 Tax=Hymenobacter sp. 5414T-23 TaxID=2932252 RepID=UPI001FD38E13|nr:GNAT family protein [Hymenobacter sp. 5414T-23]UOQ82495.1 GNAT family N-acetyltransferase [Hymenobacter sp. 5414T-23]
MIQLEYFTSSDFDQLITWIDSPHLLMNWAGPMFNFPLNRDKLDWYLQDSNELGQSEVFTFRAVDTDTGTVVGHISLGSISEKNSAARVSRVFIAPEARGRGFARRMLVEALRFGFEQLHLHRITLGVYDFNTAAISAYTRAGMQREGLFRDVLKYNDEYWSLLEMSMLQPEWQALHQNKVECLAL